MSEKWLRFARLAIHPDVWQGQFKRKLGLVIPEDPDDPWGKAMGDFTKKVNVVNDLSEAVKQADADYETKFKFTLETKRMKKSIRTILQRYKPEYDEWKEECEAIKREAALKVTKKREAITLKLDALKDFDDCNDFESFKAKFIKQ